MTNRILAALAALSLALGCSPSWAQSSFVTPGGSMVDGHAVMCPNGSGQMVPCSSTTPLVIAGTFSGSVAGWAPTPSYSQLAASDAVNHSVAVPTGADDVITNLDTTIAYCNFGAASTTATFPVEPGAVGVHNGGAFSTIQCQSPNSSLKITISGGAGLFTGGSSAGGGGSGGGTASAFAAGFPANGTAAGFEYLATLPTLTTGQMAPGLTDINGSRHATTLYATPVVVTGNITAADVGTSCVATPAPAQTQCSGTATANSFVTMSASAAGNILVSAATTGGTLSAVNITLEVSNDNVTWYGRGLFLDSNPAPVEKNGIGNAQFTGTTIGGVPFYRVRATTFTVGSGSPVINITMTQTQGTGLVYVGNLPTSANGTAAVAAVPMQGNGTTALPINTNQQQLDNVALGAPTAVGTPSAGLVPTVNAEVLNSITASFSQFAPNGNFSTPLTVGATSSRTAVPSGSGTTIAVYNTGSNAAFVALGSSSVVATAADDQVAPGGFLCFAVGANADIAAIETAGATTLNISGGSGGCAGSGGGGGGSSSAGNVFQATAFAQGTLTAAGTTTVITASGSLTIYLVNYSENTDSSATGAADFQIVTGTGSNCATVNQTLTPLRSFTANNGVVEGPIGVIGVSTAGDELCVKSTTATSGNPVKYRIGVAQQ